MQKRSMTVPDDLTRRRLIATGARVALALPLVGLACGAEPDAAQEQAATPSPPPAVPPQPPRATPPPQAPAPEPPPAGGPEETRLVPEVPAVAGTVSTLQYVAASARPDQQCGNCQFYTAREGGRGKCQLFVQGLVAEGGWCISWTAKL